MTFTGFSSDEEGSIVFDGEQFIINNPDNVPPDFDPGDRPAIYTRPPVVPSTPVAPPTAPVQQSQPESTSESTQSSQTFRLGERILRRNRDRARQDAAAQSKAPPLQVIDEVPDVADFGYIDSERLPVSVAPDWPGSTPLSQGQSLHVDHLLSTETDTLAREVLIGIRREGIPPEALLYDFMSQYAEWGWDDLSSAWAVQVLNMIRQSDWDEVFAHADSTPVETIAQDLGSNTREGLVIIDAGSGNVVLNKTGVRGPGGQQYVGLQDYEVEALRGLDLIFVHNHTNDTGASKDDLLSAFDAGAKLLIVITQSGREQVYIRGRYGMVEVRDAKASYKVGSPTLDETIALANKSAEQAAAYREDPPEYVFLEDEPLWWQRANIIVPYNTTETTGQVAARMGVPAEHLQRLNAGNMLKGVMYIPLPGWYTQMANEPGGSGLSAIHSSGAKIMNLDSVALIDHLVLSEIDQLLLLWKSLSPVEQQIEMALIGSNANVSLRVPFGNRYDFHDTLTWIHDREDAFKRAAIDFDIPVAQLKTVIQSELLYDYDAQDQLQDDVIRAKFNLLGRQLLSRITKIRDSWDGAGVANVHYPTLYDAYHHVQALLEPGETHPWDLGSIDSSHDAPNLMLAPEIPVSNAEVSNYYDDVAYEDLKPRQIETARFILRSDRLDDVPWELRIEIARYLADDSGSVRAAAMVLRMIIDQLTEFDSNANINEDPRDMARAWGRYRTSEEYFDYAGNARLAHPLAEYWSTR